MTPVTVFRGRTVAVFGLGASGLSTCAALAAGGASVIAFDDQPERVAEAAAKGYTTRNLREIDWNAIAALILSPGVPLTHPEMHWSVKLAHLAVVEVIGDIELFCRQRRALASRSPFAAITGTNGKSTTTALIDHVLGKAGRDVAVGGNLGTPILSLAPPSQSRVHVIECSSFQIDLAPTLDPSVGILLNLAPDHLDRHGTMANYVAIKERLIAGTERAGTAIVGVDDEYCQAIADRAERAGTRVVRVSVRRRALSGIYLEGERLVDAEDGRERFSIPLSGIGSLRGVHNAQNAACAYAAARAFGVPAHEIAHGLKSFPGLAHRMQEIGRKGAVLFVNDSKATNVDAAARALASFSDIFWIAGGRAKESGLKGLEGYFSRIRKAYLIGEAARDFAAAIEGVVKHEIVGTLERAVEIAAEDAERSRAKEPVVLLSPACASFDQFPNFEVRGDTFRKLVRAMPGVAAVGAEKETIS
jgi:UDP-N-acetylmuramoylalanine--D-glutamate ligase